MTPPGITYRWAQPAELQQVARLSADVFDPSADPADSWITRLVDDVARGEHPQADPADYAIAVEESSGHIVGAAVLFEQPWRFGTTTLATGRPEVVVTARSHRGQGVMRGVLGLLHDRSAERKHVAQSITGVPGVYRHLGYEYTHLLGDGRIARIDGTNANGDGDGDGGLELRSATGDDAREISALLDTAAPSVDVATPQHAAYARFCAERQDPSSFRGVRIVLAHDGGGALSAVFELSRHREPDRVHVLAAAVSRSTDPTAAFRALLARELPAARGEVVLALGQAHELYNVSDALGFQVRPWTPDRWYFRVPDVSAFLLALRQELDARLAASIFRRHTGALTLDLRSGPVTVRVLRGIVSSIDTGEPSEVRLAVGQESLPALLTGAAASVSNLILASPETHGSSAAVGLADVLLPTLTARTLALN